MPTTGHRSRTHAAALALVACMTIAPASRARDDGGAPDCADAVRSIHEALATVLDVSCVIEHERIPATGRLTPPRTVRMLLPDHVRIESVDAWGNERLVIRNGDVDWTVSSPNRARKTVRGGTPAVPLDTPVPVVGPTGYRFLGDGATCARGRAFDRLEYRGLDTLRDERCHVFLTRNGRVRTWIGAEDGLLRRQERQDGEILNVTRFTGLVVNAGLTPESFAYEPPPGSTVEVSEHVDGVWRRHRTVVPAEPVDHAAALDALETVAALRGAFAAHDSVTLQFSETYVAHAVIATAADGTQSRVGYEREGTLRLAPGNRLRYRAIERTTGVGIERDLLTVSDGTTVWRSDRTLGHDDAAPRLVIRTPRDGRSAADGVPDWLCAPLGGIGAERVRIDGTEILDGVACVRCRVSTAGGTPSALHWIGRDDGVPRRIEVLNDGGAVVERTLIVSAVETGPDPGAEEFAVADDGTVTMIDADRRFGGVDPASVD